MRTNAYGENRSSTRGLGREATTTLADYLRVVRRRKWIVVIALLVAPAIAYYASSRQHVRYQAAAQVLLSAQGAGSVLGNSQSSSLTPSSPQTQVTLARVPDVARLATRKLTPPMSASAFLAATSVGASSDGGILTFVAWSGDSGLAGRMATAYARAYIRYRYASETAGLEAARRSLEARLAKTPSGPVHNSLVVKLQALEEAKALHTADARLIQTAAPGVEIGIQTRRNVAIGLALGLVLGVGLAFLFEALDMRVRSSDAVEERLAMPMLGRLPAPSRKLQRKRRLAMLEEPDGLHAEAVRMLRTNFEFALLGQDIRTVMVTSAVEQEGKSTTIANLAVALARAGQPVTLVDLDLRRPYLHQFFYADGRPGLTDVALGRASLDDALKPVEVGPDIFRRANGGTNGTGSVGRIGVVKAARPKTLLHVIRLGPVPPDPGEFISTKPLERILDALTARPGLVLIDAPPLLHVGDGLALSAKVDAMMVVVRMGVARRGTLVELARLLETMPSRKLGFVVTDADVDEGYGYGYAYQSYIQPEERART